MFILYHLIFFIEQILFRDSQEIPRATDESVKIVGEWFRE